MRKQNASPTGRAARRLFFLLSLFTRIRERECGRLDSTAVAFLSLVAPVNCFA